MSFTVIDRHSLMPGQWVAFSHEEKELKKELQGPFKVINRDDAMFDPEGSEKTLTGREIREKYGLTLKQ